MKKLLFAILAVVVLTFATEECNTGAYEVQAHPGSCTNFLCNELRCHAALVAASSYTVIITKHCI